MSDRIGGPGAPGPHTHPRIAKRAYIVAVDPLDHSRAMCRPDIPSGAEGTFEGKRVMAYSSEEAVALFERGEDGFPEAPWPQSVTLARPRGTTEARVANEPGLESETGGWEYQDYRRIDTGIVILMDDRRYFDQRLLQDADVVIDQHGKVIKHRTGAVTSEPMTAGPELLEQAVPVFPENSPNRGQRFHDEAARLAPPEEGFDVSTGVWSDELVAGIAVGAIILSAASFVLEFLG